jgi:hypothetical protein
MFQDSYLTLMIFLFSPALALNILFLGCWVMIHRMRQQLLNNPGDTLLSTKLSRLQKAQKWIMVVLSLWSIGLFILVRIQMQGN